MTITRFISALQIVFLFFLQENNLRKALIPFTGVRVFSALPICLRLPSLGFLVTLLCLFGLTDAALGATFTIHGLTIYGERPAFSTHVDYFFEENHDEVLGRQTDTTKHRFVEGIDMRTRGWVYHPYLLHYKLQLSPQWSQEQQQSGDSSFDQNISSLLYNVSGILLPAKPINLDFFASRSNALASSIWSENTEIFSTSYGVGSNFTVKEWPVRLAYDFTDLVQEGYYSTQRTSDRLRLNSIHYTSDHKAFVDMAYEQTVYQYVRDTTSNTTAQDRGFARMFSDLSLADDERIKLNSSFTSNYFKMDDQAYTVNLAETLAVRHLPRDSNPQVTTNYNLGAETDQDNAYSVPLGASVALSHQLYQNLTTNLGANVSQRYGRDYESQGYGVSNSFSYVRRLPLGTMRLNQGSYYTVIDQKVGDPLQTVLNENVVLQFGIETPLAHEQIDSDSIIVFVNNVLLVPDIDYSITEFAGYTYITLLSPDIIDQSSSLVPAQVNYKYLADPSAKTGSLQRTFGGGYSPWSWLDVDYSLVLTEDHVFTGERPRRLRDDQTQSITTTGRYKISTTTLILREERFAASETRQTWQLTETLGGGNTWQWAPRKNIHFQVSGSVGGGANTENSQSDVYLKDTSDVTSFYQLRGNLTWDPSRRQRVKAGAFNRYSRYDNSNSSLSAEESRSSSQTGSGFNLSYIYRYAAWLIKADYTYLLSTDDLDERLQSRNKLFLSLSRDLR